MTFVKRTRLLIGTLLYVALMSALVAGLFYLRTQSKAVQTQSDWDEWRSAAIHDEDFEGPVLRKQPKSETPPLVALLDDYFITCVVGTVVFGTALFVTFAFIINGMATSQTVIHDDP